MPKAFKGLSRDQSLMKPEEPTFQQPRHHHAVGRDGAPVGMRLVNYDCPICAQPGTMCDNTERCPYSDPG